MLPPPPHLLQAAGNCFTALCEAIVSWRHVGCEGLHNELIQLMQVGPIASRVAPAGCLPSRLGLGSASSSCKRSSAGQGLAVSTACHGLVSGPTVR